MSDPVALFASLLVFALCGDKDEICFVFSDDRNTSDLVNSRSFSRERVWPSCLALASYHFFLLLLKTWLVFFLQHFFTDLPSFLQRDSADIFRSGSCAHPRERAKGKQCGHTEEERNIRGSAARRRSMNTFSRLELRQ